MIITNQSDSHKWLIFIDDDKKRFLTYFCFYSFGAFLHYMHMKIVLKIWKRLSNDFCVYLTILCLLCDYYWWLLIAFINDYWLLV